MINFVCFLMFSESLGSWVLVHVPKSKLDQILLGPEMLIHKPYTLNPK